MRDLIVSFTLRASWDIPEYAPFLGMRQSTASGKIRASELPREAKRFWQLWLGCWPATRPLLGCFPGVYSAPVSPLMRSRSASWAVGVSLVLRQPASQSRKTYRSHVWSLAKPHLF